MSSSHEHLTTPDPGAHRAPGAGGPAPGAPGVDGDGPHPDAATSVADLLGRLSDQFTTLLRQEVELAKAEAKQEIRTAARAGAGFGAAGFSGYLALLFLSLAAAWGLAEILPAGIAFLIVGVVYGLATAVLFLQAKKAAEDVDPTLHQTKASLEATAEWAKDTTT